MHVPVRKDLFSGRGKEKLANSLKFKSSAEAGLIGGMGGGQQTEAGYKNGNYDKGAQNYDDRQYEDEGYEYAGDRSEGGQENGAGAEVDDEEDIKEDRNGKMIKVPKQLAPSQRGIRESQQLLDNQKALMTQIKDYEYRANACRRAGRRLAEAVAHYCMGVLYDNLRKFKMAIDCYLQFLEILKFTQDTFMEALGHNSIGVSYFKLGTQYYDRALFHHARHSDIADVPGQFIAYSNMGLIYYHMKQFANAADQHKQALKCAITMSSVTGQSIAIGNLGNMQFLLTDLAGARACTERHLELSISLEDLHAQMAASLKLGEICMRMEDFDSSFFFFNQALSLAATLRDKETVAQAKVKIGLLKGQSQLHQRMANMGRAVEDAMMNLRVAAVQEQQEQEAKMQRKLAELERHKKEQADAQAAIAAALAEKEKAKGAVMRKSTEKKKKDGEE